MKIANTNIEIKDGNYILTYCSSGNSYGERITIITNDLKATVKKYKAAGYYLFNSLFYFDYKFFQLTKKFTIRTTNKRQWVIQNAMYHIQMAADNGKLQTEM